MSFSEQIRRITAGVLVAIALTVTVGAAELLPKTVKAFEGYVALAEARPATPFLWIDGQPAAERTRHLADLRGGGLVIDRMRVRAKGRDIDIPDGLVHHWVGTVFVPNASTADALRLLQDYDRHAAIYSPAVA